MVATADAVIGIDVSKDRLDVHVRPSGEGFAVPRDAAGIADLISRLRALSCKAIGLQATGGHEAVVAASLAAACLSVVALDPARARAFAARSASAPRPTRSPPP